jgi:hypothetical protein
LNVHPVESDAKSPGRVDDGRRVPGRCRAEEDPRGGRGRS